MILQAEVFCVSGETQQKLGNDHRRAQKCETISLISSLLSK